MQKTEDGYRWTIRLSKKDYSQKEVSNLAPTIYLEPYFNDYHCGEPMKDICQRI